MQQYDMKKRKLTDTYRYLQYLSRIYTDLATSQTGQENKMWPQKCITVLPLIDHRLVYRVAREAGASNLVDTAAETAPNHFNEGLLYGYLIMLRWCIKQV